MGFFFIKKENKQTIFQLPVQLYCKTKLNVGLFKNKQQNVCRARMADFSNEISDRNVGLPKKNVGQAYSTFYKMNYKPSNPNQIGTFYINDIPLDEVIRFIDWRFYFTAWRISGRYEGIEKVHRCISCEASWLSEFDEKDRKKAEEALKLFRDTQVILKDVVEQKSLKINAVYSIFPAYSEDDNIIIKAKTGQITLPTLRQQKPSADGFCYSLSDFGGRE